MYYVHPIIQNRIMSCHGNGSISQRPNHVFFLGDNFLHLAGPSEKFGTHENISCDGRCKVGLIRRQPNCLVFYSRFQRLFKLKLHNINLKYWHF